MQYTEEYVLVTSLPGLPERREVLGDAASEADALAAWERDRKAAPSGVSVRLERVMTVTVAHAAKA